MPTDTSQRSSYQERWLSMPMEKKLKVTGGDKDAVKELDRWASGKLPTNREAAAAELAEETPTLAVRLAGLRAHHNDLIKRRNINFAKRLMLGQQVSLVAKDAAVSAMIVNVGTGISEKNRSPAA